jgi:hypothetical protein
LAVRGEASLAQLLHAELTLRVHITTVTIQGQIGSRPRFGYADLGGDYYTGRNLDKTKQPALNQLRDLGYSVTLNELPVAS